MIRRLVNIDAHKALTIGVINDVILWQQLHPIATKAKFNDRELVPITTVDIRRAIVLCQGDPLTHTLHYWTIIPSRNVSARCSCVCESLNQWQSILFPVKRDTGDVIRPEEASWDYL